MKPSTTSLPNGTPIAAAWDGSDVIGGGRVVVFMDINWLEQGWSVSDAPAAMALLDNIATFLTGTPAHASSFTPHALALPTTTDTTHPVPLTAAR